jgi:hypothetical protein
MVINQKIGTMLYLWCFITLLTTPLALLCVQLYIVTYTQGILFLKDIFTSVPYCNIVEQTSTNYQSQHGQF